MEVPVRQVPTQSSKGSRRTSAVPASSLRTSTVPSRMSSEWRGLLSQSSYSFRLCLSLPALINDNEGWGDMDVPDEPEVVVPAFKITEPVATPKTKPIAAPKARIPSPVVTTVPPSPDTPRSQSPAMNAPEKAATPLVSLASMSKEEKEIEMARRREERKAVRQGFEVVSGSNRLTELLICIS